MYHLVLVLLVAATAVVKGADWFVLSAAWMARRTGRTEMAVGATLVAVATTLPELAFSTHASWNHHPGLALGNALGSSMVNGGLILGAMVAIQGFTWTGREFGRRCAGLLGASVLMSLLAGDGEISRAGGAVLLGPAGAGALLALGRGWGGAGGRRAASTSAGAGASRAAAPPPGGAGDAAGQVLRFLFGAMLIAVGSRYLVSAGSQLAAAAGLRQAAAGLALVSAGTSLPELATAAAARWRGHSQLAVGNLLGASTLNLTLVPGLSALVRPLAVEPAAAWAHLPLVAALSLLLLLFGTVRRRLGRAEGITLLALFLLHLALVFRA